ncbi:Aspartate--tRNA ligase, cytoplasmic [Sphaceloma murrayae]|uniref:aspartate--tRNA ligase n=1 Tax=Sphaceloma murrayae TaxID=2082308 RepID=A0A2K1QX52_9PEZI|nr:Aspartate--tRNA ligase, cytoplasmic [Sphaceloma murrayae]
MADQPGPTGQPAESLPERPKQDGAAAPEGEKGPSKSALKKAQKEKEKAEKAAKRKAEEDAQRAAAAANDVSKKDYGELPVLSSDPPSGAPRVTLAELSKQYASTTTADEADGPEVTFRATVENARNQSAKLSFLLLGQSGDTVQAVVAESPTLSRQMVKFCGSVPTESVVIVHGVVKKPFENVKSATVGHIEIHIKKLYIECRAESMLPMQVSDAEGPIPADGEEEKGTDGKAIVTLNTRLNNRIIDLRARHNRAIFKIKHGVTQLFREFLDSKDFVGVQTPKLLGSASEGGANVFEVKYFERKAYLAQSPQLYKQMLIAARMERVYEVGPVFRAENSNTARHLTEFTGLDLEMEFQEHYHEVVDFLEALMLFILNGLKDRYGKETDLIRSIYHVEEFKLPEVGKTVRIPFSEGIKMLREDGVEVGEFDDLSTPDEKRLGRLILQKYNTDFYILDKYPLAIRPFYTMPAPDSPAFTPDAKDPNGGYSNSYDFFMRGQEIMSGAQRIHNADFLVKRMKEHVTPVDPEAPGLKDYVDGFRYGCPPHAGGGIGLERIVMLWLGLPNVRLGSLFPRDPSRLAP